MLSSCAGPGVVPNRGSLCDPDVMKMGPDTFLAKDSCGGRYALIGADVTCRQLGRNVLVTNRNEGEVIFRCLDSNDPAYRRPEYPTPSTVIIQDGRK